VAAEAGGHRSSAGGEPRRGRRLRSIRYAHTAAPEDEAAPEEAGPQQAAQEGTPGEELPGLVLSGPVLTGTVLPGTVLPGTVLSGTVLPGPEVAGEEPEAYEGSAYEGEGGLVYEPPRPAYSEPAGAENAEIADTEPVPGANNEGLGIFGDVATTEVPDDTRPQPQVIPIGAAWNQPIGSPPVASDAADESRPNPFERLPGGRWAAQPADEHEPRVSVRDLPPDVQLRFWRLRFIIMVVVGVLFAILTKSWEIALTLAILAGIVDTIYRSRNAASYVSGGSHPGSRRRTNKQLARMRRDGYFALDARPIPDSREFIDHLVVGPTGVYAIDSEKWDPKMPIRTWNGKKLYHGPESQKDRLEHAVWEASQASELLSAALGTKIEVRPALAIYGPKIPWDIATIRNVDVFTGPSLRKYLRRRGRMKDGVARLTREEVRTIYDTASRVLPGVAHASSPSTTYTPVG
jgi:hypothetical protein